MTDDARDGDSPSPDASLAVAPPYLPVTISADRIQFRTGPWSGPVVTLEDDDGEGLLGELPGLLDGRRTFADLLERFDADHRDELRSAITRLYDDGVVVEVPGHDRDRIDGYLAADPTVDPSVAPSESSVLVVNIGAIGRMVAGDLARLGFDRVALLEPHAEDPESSVVAAVERHPAGTSLSDAIEDVDYVVYTVNRPDHGLGRRINTVALDHGIPWISARLTGLDGQVGPMILPRRSACYECYLRRARATMPAAYRDRAAGVETSDLGPLRAHARILAGWLVTDFIRLVGEGTGFTLGGVIHFDFFDMTVEPNPVLKLPRCPACGTADRTRLDVKRFVDHDRLLEDGR